MACVEFKDMSLVKVLCIRTAGHIENLLSMPAVKSGSGTVFSVLVYFVGVGVGLRSHVYELNIISVQI